MSGERQRCFPAGPALPPVLPDSHLIEYLSLVLSAAALVRDAGPRGFQPLGFELWISRCKAKKARVRMAYRRFYLFV